MQKIFKRGLSLFLSLLIILTSVPFTRVNASSFDLLSNIVDSVSGIVKADNSQKTEDDDYANSYDKPEIELDFFSENLDLFSVENEFSEEFEESFSFECEQALYNSVSAVSESGDEQENSETSSATKGVINETITWEYDGKTKTLTISGEGGLPAFYPREYYEDESIPEEERVPEEEWVLAPWNEHLPVMEKVVIGDGITAIGEYNFCMVPSLTEIDFGNTVQSLGEGVFGYAEAIISLTLPDSLTSLGEAAFAYTTSLTQVTFGNKIAEIPDGAFAMSAALTEINFGNSLQAIGDGAFACSYNLTSITFPDSLITLGDYTFAFASNLTEINFGNSLQTIGEDAFVGCTGVEVLKFPASLREIGEDAFVAAVSLRELYLNEGLETIGKDAFQNALFLEKLYIPSTYTGEGWELTVYCDCDFVINSSAPFTVDYITIEDADREFYKKLLAFHYDFEAMMEMGVYDDYDEEEQKAIYVSEYNKIFGTDYDNYDELDAVISEAIGSINAKMFPSENCVISFTNNETLHTDCREMYVTHYVNGSEEPCECFKFSGEYYDGMFWSVDKDTRTLTLSGTTAEKPLEAGLGYNEYIYANKYIDKVVYASDSAITTIDEYAFYQMDIKSITIPANISIIRYHAFRGCNKLTEVIFEEHPDGANAYCTIWGEAFRRCDSLKEIDLPEHIHWLSDNAFNMSSIEKITIRRRDCQIGDTGVPETIPADTLICCLKDSTAEAFAKTNGRDYAYIDPFVVEDLQYVIGYVSGYDSNVVIIEEYNGNASFVDIPSEIDGLPVGKIGANAFSGNPMLRKITVPDTVKVIGSNAFAGDKLKEITIPASVTSMNSALASAMSLEKVIFEENTTAVTQRALYGASCVKEVIIPDTVTTIEDYAFYGCTSLSEIKLPEGLTTLKNKAFINTAISEITIPENVITMSNAFDGSSTLKKVIFKDGSKAVPDNALNGALSLTQVVLPDTVISIGASAFSNCPALEEFTLPKKVTEIPKNCFKNSSALKTVNISGDVTKIGDYAFSGCEAITEFVVPLGMKNIGVNAFEGTSLTEFSVPVSVTTMSKALSGIPSLKKVVFEVGVTAIPPGALQNSNVSQVVLPATLKTINSNAFYNCKNLSELVLPENLETIGQQAFYGTAISEITIPGNVISMSKAFDGATSLKNIIFPNGCLAIPEYALYGASALEQVVIPESASEIKAYAFYNCKAIKNVNLMNVVKIGNHAFDGCTALTEFEISDKIKNIGEYALKNTGVTTLTVPGTVSVSNNAFRSMKELLSVVLEEGVTTVPRYAFYDCSALIDIKIPSTLTEIKTDAFAGCTALQDVYATDIDSWMNCKFSGPNSTPMNFAEKIYFGEMKVTSVVVPDTRVTIGNYCFYSWDELSSVIIPDSVSEIGDSAFEGCSALKRISLPSKVSVVSGKLLKDCTSLEDVFVCGIVGTIGAKAFENINGNCVFHTFKQTPVYQYAVENGYETEAMSDLLAPEITKFTVSPETVKNDYFTINVRATDNTSLSSLTVDYFLEGTTEYVNIANESYIEHTPEENISVKFDVSDLASGKYYIRSIATDGYGNYVKELNFCDVDNTPPEKPLNFTVTGTPDYIKVDWVKNDVEDDFCHFKVYRSTSPDLGFECIETLSTIGCFDTDATGVLTGTTYYYYVTAVDKLGNESERTEVLSGAVSADTKAPQLYSYLKDTKGKIYNVGTVKFRVSALDNFKLASVALNYRIKGDSDWTVGEVRNVDKISEIVVLDWNVEDIQPGEYEVLFVITDASGNVSENSAVDYTVYGYTELDVPKVKTESAHKSVKITWEHESDKDLVNHYTVYRRPKNSSKFSEVIKTRSLSYTDKIAVGEYVYKIVMTDVYGFTVESAEIAGNSILDDKESPEVFISVGNLQIALGKEIVFDAAASKDNDRIASCLWNFGDGNISESVSVEHTYEKAGEYMVSLTVTDEAGNSATEYTEVTVVDINTTIGKELVEINVKNSIGEAIENANVVIMEEFSGDETIVRTDSEGKAEIILDKGKTYYMSTYKENSSYEISKNTIDLEENKDLILPENSLIKSMSSKAKKRTIDVVLRASNFSGSVDSHLMSAEEIEAAGIEAFSKPVTKFTVEFEYAPVFENEETGNNELEKLKQTIYTVDGKPIITCWDSSATNHIAGPASFYCYSGGVPHAVLSMKPEKGPENNYHNYTLKLSGYSSCMNQVFRVDLIMANASATDWMQDCSATIRLPSGLELVNSSLTQNVSRIERLGVSTATWYVMGVDPGEYNISVDVNGTIYPSPVEEYNATFTTAEAIQILDLADAFEIIHVSYHETVKPGKPYTTTVAIANVSGIKLNYVYIELGGAGVYLEEMKPGQVASFTFLFVPDFGHGDKEVIYGQLINKVIKAQGIPIFKFMTSETPEEPSGQNHSHSYKSSIKKPATCRTKGVRIYTCYCGDTYEEAIESTLHIAGSMQLVEKATCTTSGYNAAYCRICEQETGREVIAASGHSSETTTTKATLTKNGKVESKCSVCGYVKSTTTVYYPKTINLSKTAYTYNGKVQTPTVTVKDSKGNTLKKDTDYTVKYESGRKNTGKYSVTITFKGKYSGIKKLTYTIAPKVTSKITATQTTSTITLKWNKVTGADGYRVYKYNTKTKKWDSIKTTTATSYKVQKLKAGTTYKFKIKAYKKDDGTIWGNATAAFTTATKPAVTSKITATQTKTTITLKWSKVTGADGYRVYQYNTKTKKWDSIKTLTGTSYKVENLKAGTSYKFKIKAYKKVNGTIWGSNSAAFETATKPATPKITKLTATKGKVTFTWSNVAGETGYQVYYSAKKDSGYKKASSYKTNVVKGSKSKLTSGKKYYFKVRAYKKTASGTVHSSWSSVKSVKIK